MSIKVNLKWFSKAKSEEEKQKIKSHLEGSLLIMRLLRDLLEDMEKTITSNMLKDETWKTQASTWPYRQAGYVAELQLLKKVKDLLPKEEN